MLDQIAVLWPTVPVVALALLGVGLVGLAIVRQIRTHIPWSQTTRLLIWLRGFRLAIIGLALVGVALGLLWDQTWLLVLSLAVAGEESFETTWIISTLERDRRRRAS